MLGRYQGYLQATFLYQRHALITTKCNVCGKGQKNTASFFPLQSRTTENQLSGLNVETPAESIPFSTLEPRNGKWDFCPSSLNTTHRTSSLFHCPCMLDFEADAKLMLSLGGCTWYGQHHALTLVTLQPLAVLFGHSWWLSSSLCFLEYLLKCSWSHLGVEWSHHCDWYLYLLR